MRHFLGGDKNRDTYQRDTSNEGRKNDSSSCDTLQWDNWEKT